MLASKEGGRPQPHTTEGVYPPNNAWSAAKGGMSGRGRPPSVVDKASRAAREGSLCVMSGRGGAYFT